MQIRLSSEQVQHLREGGLALSDGKGKVEVLQKPAGAPPLEWSNLQGKLSKELGGFRPIGKGEVVGALWRAAGLNDTQGNTAAGRALKDRFMGILKNKDDTPAAAATAYLVYQRLADPKSAGGVAKGDAPAPARTESKAMPSGGADDKALRMRKAMEGMKQSRTQLEVYVSRNAGSLPAQDIKKIVATAVLIASSDAMLGEKLTSASLAPHELDDLAKKAIERTIGGPDQDVDA